MTDTVSTDAISLSFESSGNATAVLHVYDRLALNAVPRRYTLPERGTLSDEWKTHDGHYDLWVIGPNNFHRHFAGSTKEQAPSVNWQFDRRAVSLSIVVSAGAVSVTPGAYDDHLDRWSSNRSAAKRWKLDDTRGWYDLIVTSPAAPSFKRRLAGRLETGRHSITDPAIAIAKKQIV